MGGVQEVYSSYSFFTTAQLHATVDFTPDERASVTHWI
jgi:hypothetical protein